MLLPVSSVLVRAVGPGGGGVGEGVVLGVVNTEGVLTHDGAASWTVGMKLCDMCHIIVQILYRLKHFLDISILAYCVPLEVYCSTINSVIDGVFNILKVYNGLLNSLIKWPY